MAGTRNLSPGRIADAALAIVDAHGLSALSARSLAQALGVGPMAVYHHLPGMEAVLDAVLEKVLAGIALPAPTGRTIPDLEAIARAYVAGLLRHPNAIPLLAGRRFNSAGTLAFLEAVFGNLGGAGLTARETAAAFRILGYFLNGALMAHAATRDAARRPDFRLTSPGMLAGRPFLGEVLAHVDSEAMEGLFDEGLGLVLDGLSRRFLSGHGKVAEDMPETPMAGGPGPGLTPRRA